jgi:hypothetical protein
LLTGVKSRGTVLCEQRSATSSDQDVLESRREEGSS